MAIAIWDAKVVKERELVSAEQQEKLYLFTFYLAWAKRLPLTYSIEPMFLAMQAVLDLHCPPGQKNVHCLNKDKTLSNIHCKPKPCKAYRELPVSQFSQGKTYFHCRDPCSHCRVPVFITGISL